MGLVRNAWYAAAWSEEVKDNLFPRRILGDPVVLFRKDDGGVSALYDMCPHRFAPLHLGQKVDGCRVQCPYHGLQFNADGVCVQNPHGDGKIPASARVRTYPVVERDTIIWIWPGDPELAKPGDIPDYSFLNRTDEFDVTPGHVATMHLKIELILDNLMDLSHAAYLHRATLGSEAVGRGITNVKEIPGGLLVENFYPSGTPSPVFVTCGAARSDEIVDFWNDVRWIAPGSLYLDAGISPVGRPRSEGHIFSSTQLLTPETEESTHYFWNVFRNFNRNNPDLTAGIEAAVTQAFDCEDKPMISAVQERMAGKEFWNMKPILLPTDGAAVRARRIMLKLVDSEKSNQKQCEERK